MRILMLGNSFTYFHDVPGILSVLLDEEVKSHTRGGAYLKEHLDPETELGAKTIKALEEEKWDYVVLQEQSFGPIGKQEEFLESVEELCERIRKAGAKPVMYATWAYKEGSEKLAGTGMSYEEMDSALYAAYHRAAQENDALTADVGTAFTRLRDMLELYTPDDYHPTETGSMLAASIIAEAIRQNEKA